MMEANRPAAIRKRFDEAKTYESMGEFGKAALCYERIIEDFDDIYVKHVARRNLKWCIPLNIISERMRLMSCPVSVSEMLRAACKADEELSREPHELIVREIESRLTQLRTCRRIGSQLWVLDDHFGECVQDAVATVLQSPTPLSLRDLLRNHWPEYAEKHPAFPDHLGLNALAAELRKHEDIEIIGHEYCICATSAARAVERFQELIRMEGRPVELGAQLPTLFPTFAFTPQTQPAIENFLQPRFDKRFVEVAPGLWFLRDMVTLETDTFEDVFGASPLCQSTDMLINARLFPSTKDAPQISRSFRRYGGSLLRRNPALVEIGHQYWLSKSVLPVVCQEAIALLKENDQPMTASEVVAKGLMKESANHSQVAVLANLVDVKFREAPEVLQVDRGQWLHESAVTRALDRVYTLLLQEERARSTGLLLASAFSLPSASVSEVKRLQERFDQELQADLRFVFNAAGDGWRAVPPGPVGNLPAYYVLWEYRRLLSSDAITEHARNRFPTRHLDFDLKDDKRFHVWPGGKWGLSQWIDLSDLAYEYLRKKQKPLLARTIINKVCEQHGIDPSVGIFTPEEDSRFVPRQYGRWYCRHAVTDAELDQMLTLLCSVDEGLALDDLVIQTIGLEACVTDAHERVAQDERFVSVAGRWFARERVFYHLTDKDVDQLLMELGRERTGLRLTTLVQRVLDREAHLTDAESRLRADSRFREILPGVWTVKDLQPPSEARTPIFNRPVRSEKVEVIPEAEYTIAEDFTERKRRPDGEATLLPRTQITRTLSLLDVRDGNLVINRAIASLLSADDAVAIHFTDELGNEFTAWVDKENNLLQGLRTWFGARKLTFGDKIVIKATDQMGFLGIQPKGERDERVYREALEREDIEKLIESAREKHKSYHDLMIEVMAYFNQAAAEPVPLHREDIYNLVNYNRTASHRYIFSLLSLTDCPYEELRYFVSHGRGYWSFDRERRKAFEMKMKELVEKVEQLEAENRRLQDIVTPPRGGEVESSAEIARLTKQVQEQEARIGELSTQNAELSETNRRLSVANEDQLRRLKDLDTQVSTLKQQMAKQTTESETLHLNCESLGKELANAQRERDELRGSEESRARQIEKLEQDKASLEGETTALRAKVEHLASQNTVLKEDMDRLESQAARLAKENTTLQQQHKQATVTLQSQVETWQHKYESLVETLEGRQGELDMTAEEVAHLIATVDRVRAALQTPLGKGFVLLSRIVRGPDLSDL